jgi:predicted acyl esterase
LRRATIAAAVAVLALPAAAEAAPPLPFGHACTPQSGVLFCPTASDDQRVPSFDGVPLDVDVTLPPTGDGPFPTIVILHGFGGSKGDFEAVNAEGLQANGVVKTTAYHNNNVFYAQRGYAVVNYSARGFGRSCGAPDSRASPGCDRGWIHLADQRYEVRDTQHLLGLLVDQGVSRADALGVTGESYGGG